MDSLLFIVTYLTCILIISFTLVGSIISILEAVKEKRNPIPKMINHDKRFSEINNIYTHNMFDVKRGY